MPSPVAKQRRHGRDADQGDHQAVFDRGRAGVVGGETPEGADCAGAKRGEAIHGVNRCLESLSRPSRCNVGRHSNVIRCEMSGSSAGGIG